MQKAAFYTHRKEILTKMIGGCNIGIWPREERPCEHFWDGVSGQFQNLWADMDESL